VDYRSAYRTERIVLEGTITDPEQPRSLRLYLRATGERWLGTIQMVKGLGPRANNAVSYWTELDRVNDRDRR
jgi:hypothetical protein